MVQRPGWLIIQNSRSCDTFYSIGYRLLEIEQELRMVLFLSPTRGTRQWGQSAWPRAKHDAMDFEHGTSLFESQWSNTVPTQPCMTALLKYSENILRGWAEKFVGWLWCNDRIWPNMVLFFNIVSLAVHTLLPSAWQRLDSRGVQDLILILKKVVNCRYMYDLIIGPKLLPSQILSVLCFFGSCWGTENSQMVTNQENMEGHQPIQSHSHAQQPLQPQTCVQEHCPGETDLPSSVFQAVSETSLVLLSKSWIAYPASAGLSGRKQCS